MNKNLIAILFYPAIFAAVTIGYFIAPTNLAGPGLDMLILLIGFIAALVLIIRSLLKAINKKDKSYWITFRIYFWGLVLSILIPFFLSWIFKN